MPDKSDHGSSSQFLEQLSWSLSLCSRLSFLPPPSPLVVESLVQFRRCTTLLARLGRALHQELSRHSGRAASRPCRTPSSTPRREYELASSASLPLKMQRQLRLACKQHTRYRLMEGRLRSRTDGPSLPLSSSKDRRRTTYGIPFHPRPSSLSSWIHLLSACPAAKSSTR